MLVNFASRTAKRDQRVSGTFVMRNGSRKIAFAIPVIRVIVFMVMRVVRDVIMLMRMGIARVGSGYEIEDDRKRQQHSHTQPPPGGRVDPCEAEANALQPGLLSAELAINDRCRVVLTVS